MKLFKELSADRQDYFRSNLHSKGAVAHCRFLHQGQCLNVSTGEMHSKGSNIMYHTIYWNVSAPVAKELAKELGLNIWFGE
jgi:hypothetical protein